MFYFPSYSFMSRNTILFFREVMIIYLNSQPQQYLYCLLQNCLFEAKMVNSIRESTVIFVY